ncbi:hypothetical protein HELRODRAFT_164097 [Helobdella robusta]|uniref:Uncharacterized protein n=1 Tax=Helobdella robusta TaxID=6412 RepID=T1EUX3_HELRO|nr:hypothetical protein HELRODRAFT_164097 [Helobdella robusta]ESN94286.1 hypothetical protein HELRODRAFT_164097 [Helobdella robusta]
MPPSVAGRESVGGRIGNLSMAGVGSKITRTVVSESYDSFVESFFKMSSNYSLVDYIPKHSCGKFGLVLINILKNICDHPSDSTAWKHSPEKKTVSVSITAQQLMLCLKQFPKGTSGGRDGLSLQHLRELTQDKTESTELINAVTCFINLLLNVHPSKVHSKLYIR